MFFGRGTELIPVQDIYNVKPVCLIVMKYNEMHIPTKEINNDTLPVSKCDSSVHESCPRQSFFIVSVIKAVL